MSGYKHGNWYCKPANEAEAKEIIARALVSGASHTDRIGKNTCYPNVYEWDYFQYWGVFGGYTCGNSDSFFKDYAGVEYTIAQVREKFPISKSPAGTSASVRREVYTV